MKQIKIHDKIFKIFLPYGKILPAVKKMAESMNNDLAGTNPLFICILNGSFIFAAELFKHLTLTTAEITFVKLASYSGDSSTGNVKNIIGLNENIEGRTVVILEDIIDSGLTISKIYEQLSVMNPEQIIIATLLFKPAAVKKQVKIDYVGIEIPNDFVVGYGLDYNGYGRNLKNIYSLIND